jgi:aminoglycoside 6'-N-acetyltransferase
MAGLSWPVLDDWYQIAVDLDGRMIGDVGVHRSADGREATIGYTLAREHQGHGFATEAVATVVDQLFAEGTERINASIDPANTASARLLDRLGFRLVRHATAVVRGETVPDDQYLLVRGQ